MTSTGRVLDVPALRSFVAVCDRGGFHRAAAVLHISQPTVSNHVRRLETACGQALLRRVGRSARLTPAGETLLADARRMLELHDDVLARLSGPPATQLTVGSTEHAADQLLPRLSTALDGQVRFRLDRGAGLRTAVDRGDLDLALLPRRPGDDRAADAGALDVRWFAAPGWSPPAVGPVPLVALDEPCALRDRAMATLDADGHTVTVACEAAYLAGVLAAARAGLGVTLLATLGEVPEGLAPVATLPSPAPIPMTLRHRRDLPAASIAPAAGAIRRVLAAPTPPTRSSGVVTGGPPAAGR